MDDRYSRQKLFSPIGKAGQDKLKEAVVTIVGMGALGTVLANHMVRGGVGKIRIIDRDFVEMSNLQRQMLYDEEDASHHLPKVIAAEKKLKCINSQVEVEPIFVDLHTGNAEKWLVNSDVILDGTDNFSVRYLINDVCVKHHIPWIYGGAVSARGMFATILPGKTPCFRCLFPHPPVGRGETCDTIGVIGPIVHVIASYQAVEAFKLLVGDMKHVNPHMEHFEIWHNIHSQMDVSLGRNHECPACVHHRFDFLDPSQEQEIFTSLCGRNTIQISPREERSVDLQELAKRLRPLGSICVNPFLLRFGIDDYTLVFFRDGRVLVQGTEEISVARTLYAKYIGQ